MPAPTFNHAKLLNERQCCDASGCHSARHGVNRWCREHLNTAKRYGHPQAGPLRATRWATERDQVRALLSANGDHPGLQQVLSMLKAWMATATSNESAYPGANEVARVARHGVPPMDILVEVCAFWAWLQSNPRALPQGGPDGDRAVDFAVSRAVCGLAPRPRRVSWASPTKTSYSPKARSTSLAHIGRHLRQSLAPFLANVSHHVEPPEAKAARAAEAMKAPFFRPSL